MVTCIYAINELFAVSYLSNYPLSFLTPDQGRAASSAVVFGECGYPCLTDPVLISPRCITRI